MRASIGRMGSFKRAVIFLSHAFAAIHFSAAAADCGQCCWSAAPQMHGSK